MKTILDLVKYLFLFSSYCLYVYHRKLFFLLSNEINEDVTFSTEQYGYTISISSFCYMLSKLVVGSLNDVFQARNVLVGSLLIISLSTLLMSQAESVAGFYLCIAINAMCQGGGWTAIIKLLKIHYPIEHFPILFSFLACTNNVAGFLAPFSIFHSWRIHLLYAGTISIIFCSILYSLLLRRNLINPKRQHHSKKLRISDFLFIFQSRPIWITGVMLGFAMEIRTITESWAPLFLQNAQNNFNSKQFWTIFEIGGLIGSLVSGALVQLFYRVMSKEASRFLVANFSTFFLLLMSTWLFFDSTYYTLLAFFIGFNVYGAINVWGIISAEIASDNIAATANSVVAFISNSSSILAGGPIAYIITLYGFEAIIHIIGSQILLYFIILYFSHNVQLYIDKDKFE